MLSHKGPPTRVWHAREVRDWTGPVLEDSWSVNSTRKRKIWVEFVLMSILSVSFYQSILGEDMKINDQNPTICMYFYNKIY